MATETIPFDASIYLSDPNAQSELLEDAFASGAADYIAIAKDVIAQAKGAAQVSTLGSAAQPKPIDPQN